MRTETLLVFAVAVFHELAHLVAALLLGEKILYITVMPYGLELSIDGISSPANEFLIALAGPSFNLLLATAARFLPDGRVLFYANLSMFLLNIMPILPLDGGRALKSSLSFYFGENFIRRFMRALACLMLVVLVLFGGILLYLSKFNASLLIIAGFLFAQTFCKDEPDVSTFFALTEGENKLAAHPVSKSFQLTCTASARPRQILASIPRGRYCIITVVDAGGRILGQLTEQQLAAALVSGRSNIKLKEILQKQLKNPPKSITI